MGEGVERRLADQSQMISSVQADLREVRGRLVDEVGEIHRKVGKLEEVSQRIARLEDRIARFDAVLTEIRDQQVRESNLARARAERARLQQDLDTRFAGRMEIRGLAKSLISEPGSAAIRQRVLEHRTVIGAAGSSALKEINYWLAHAVVAVASQHLGHDHTTAKAWVLSFSKDRAKSDLFMSLFYSRLGEHAAAASSMNRYLTNIDPSVLGREFSHIINALAEGELGKEARSYAFTALNRWGRTLSTGGGSTTPYGAQFDICRNHLLLNNEPLPQDGFPVLRRHVPGEQWLEIAETWRYAIACGNTAEAFRERFAELANDTTDGFRQGVHRHSQQALGALIDQPEPDEAEVLRAIRSKELIEKCDGHLERAAQLESELGDPYAETNDLATFLTQAAFEPEAFGLVPQARRFALVCAKDWIMRVGSSVTAEARAHRPHRVTVELNGWEGEIAAGASAQEESARIIREVREHIAATRRVQPPDSRTVAVAVGGAALPFVGFFQVAGIVRWLIIVLGIALVVYAGLELFTYPARLRRRDAEILEEQRRAGITITAMVGEASALLRMWDETERAGQAELSKVLNGLAP
ncbi:hypothetical protein [Actinomadura sp. 6K520]|uniref:hypothetical protein n=1 Tax=Actinomadura sp. 6K520 TaxID=2530364 RepID=UPI001049AC68|nr:hypothetical protein [Actinomadura sp. 6K520]TDE33646.1 hypothetical protein E1289_11655 [Actinomadura sp. 6K520]